MPQARRKSTRPRKRPAHTPPDQEEGSQGGDQDEGGQPSETVDLGSAEDAVAVSGTSDIKELGKVVEENKLSQEERREITRGLLAAGLIGLMGALVIAAPVLLATNRLSVEEIEKLAQLVLTPLVVIVGTVVGFYFGEAKSEEGSREGAPARLTRSRRARGRNRS